MTHEDHSPATPAVLRHLCALILAQYPFPRLQREDLEAVNGIEELDPRSLSPSSAAARRAAANMVTTEAWFANAAALGNHVQKWQAATQGDILLFHDATYPDWLRQITNPPVALFCQGDPAILNQASIAIVGSRSASSRACRYARQLAADLAQMGYLIVSGLARGIDAAAHQGACEAGGKTIAVVGNGTDIVYPPEHAGLQRRIVETGCVISELPPGTAPRAWHFPSRNRILAGLARGVLVVQAEQRSGALITARHALEENREVMAVPGDVEDPRSRGAHALLRQGATLVETCADVVAAVGEGNMHTDALQADRRALLSLLQRPRSAESLRTALGWKSPVVQVCLTELELMGWVSRDALGRFRRLRPLTPE